MARCSIVHLPTGTFWKADARYLDELVRVLERGCHVDRRVHGGDTRTRRVHCPGEGGMKFRAGFIETPGGWRMESLVEGD
jgi:hypothetical protein